MNKRGHPYESGGFVFRDTGLTFPLLTSLEQKLEIENSGGWRKICQTRLCEVRNKKTIFVSRIWITKLQIEIEV